MPNPSPEQKLMQVAYEQEAKTMDSLKIVTPQSVHKAHKAVRACRIMPAMEIRVSSLQTLPRNNSCTNANYISARSCGNGEA